MTMESMQLHQTLVIRKEKFQFSEFRFLNETSRIIAKTHLRDEIRIVAY